MLKHFRLTFEIKHIITKEVLFTKTDTVAAFDEASAALIMGLRVLEDGYTYRLLNLEEIKDEQPTNGNQHPANN